MIIKYPLFLILLFPIIGLIVFFKNIQTTHTIKFPKAAWMTSLASKKASRMLKAYRFIQVLTLNNYYTCTTSAASNRKANN